MKLKGVRTMSNLLDRPLFERYPPSDLKKEKRNLKELSSAIMHTFVIFLYLLTAQVFNAFYPQGKLNFGLMRECVLNEETAIKVSYTSTEVHEPMSLRSSLD